MDWRLTVLITLGSLGLTVNANDEYMTCSRPVKSSRSSRQQAQPPCDSMEHNKDSWCALPGPRYPWHSVRRFVFENQGLMRRMYGEVRQLSVLRMEFAGEDNNLEESRDFGDIFKPMTTFDPTMSLSSYFTTESIPTLVVTSSLEEAKLSSGDQGDTLSDVDEKTSSSSSSQADDLELLTTVADMATTTEDVISLVVDKGESVVADAGEPTEDSVEITTAPATIDENQAPNELHTAVNESSETANISISSTQAPVNSVQTSEEKTRNDSEQILFQDTEKTQSTTTTTEDPRIRTTNRQGVNACPVQEEVVAPYWANNTRGEVLALLNLYPFEQYIHWEKCTNERRQMYCRDGCRCEQQYRLHRLLAFDPHNECRGIFSDWFRFPSCCVCKCYFDDNLPDRISFNRSPRLYNRESILNNLDIDGPDVNGVDDFHFFYKSTGSNLMKQPRK